ncbi:MAG: protein kinase [Kofleriaceae bacterium]|nr:protein kinase [Kofleriaceae bacterium]
MHTSPPSSGPLSAPAEPPMDRDHTRLGELVDNRYRLDAVIGSGGMGAVYRAYHVGLRRHVAVKVLHIELVADAEIRGRFEREAMAIGKIDHPNCISIFDVGTLPDGSLYLAVELLEGDTLTALLEREGQLSVPRALGILRHLLTGLSHVHAAGLVHRDIKPDNIVLVRHGDDADFAKILDFGIAKWVAGGDGEGDVQLTQAGIAFGTPMYMSPEQAYGTPADGRADLYATAVLAFEMLCGTPPFYSDDKFEILMMHTSSPVPTMQERLHEGGQPVPAALEQIIARGLQKRPEDRFADAAEFLAALDDFARSGHLAAAAIDGTALTPLGSAASSEPPQARHAAAAAVAHGRALSAPFVMPYDGAPTSAPISMPYANTQSAPIIAPYAYPLSAAVAMPQPPRSRASAWQRWIAVPTYMRWAAGALALTLLAVTLAWCTSKPSTTTTANSVEGQAQAALVHGDARQAIELIEQTKSYTNDASLLMILGHARATKRDSGIAIDAYQRALELAPGREADVTLRANLKVLIDDKNAELAGRALTMLITRTKVEDRIDRLVDMARSDTLERRQTARQVAEATGLFSKLDLLSMYALDLDQETTCEKRRSVVAQLRAIGDPKAIPVLERAKIKLGRVGNWRNKPVNTCLVEDADVAIAYLATLADAPPTPAPATPL